MGFYSFFTVIPQQWQYIFDVSFWGSSLRSNCTTYLRSSALLGNDVVVYAFHFYKRDLLYPFLVQVSKRMLLSCKHFHPLEKKPISLTTQRCRSVLNNGVTFQNKFHFRHVTRSVQYQYDQSTHLQKCAFGC